MALLDMRNAHLQGVVIFFTSRAFYVCGILTECSFALHICRRETFKEVQTDFDAHLRRSQHFGRENIQ